MKELTREIESLRDKLSHLEAVQLIDQVEEVAGVPLLTAKVEAPHMDSLRRMVDDVKGRMKEGVIVLGSATGGKVQLVAFVSPGLVEAGLHAGRLVKEVATRCGGGGGGVRISPRRAESNRKSWTKRCAPCPIGFGDMSSDGSFFSQTGNKKRGK